MTSMQPIEDSLIYPERFASFSCGKDDIQSDHSSKQSSNAAHAIQLLKTAVTPKMAPKRFRLHHFSPFRTIFVTFSNSSGNSSLWFP